MALGEVKLSQSLPVSKTTPISPKREFEKLILEICRIAANSRAIAGEYLEILIDKSEKTTQEQTRSHQLGNYAEILGGPALLAVVGGGRCIVEGYSGIKQILNTVKKGRPGIIELLEKVSPIFEAAVPMFNIGSKVGDIGKNFFGTSQYVHQMEKEKIQNANTQWQTWANGLQEMIRNLEAGKQRLQQMEDANNR